MNTDSSQKKYEKSTYFFTNADKILGVRLGEDVYADGLEHVDDIQGLDPFVTYRFQFLDHLFTLFMEIQSTFVVLEKEEVSELLCNEIDSQKSGHGDSCFSD